MRTPLERAVRTPLERTVKERVKRILTGAGAYWFMPVQSGYGAKTLDFLGCHDGRFFAIETKREGKTPDAIQELVAHKIAGAGGRVFVIAGTNSPVLDELKAWLGGLDT